MIDTLRTVLLVALVFFISILVDITIFGIALTTGIFYAFYFYYRRSKALQRQLADLKVAAPDSPSTTSPPYNIPPPPSTDA